MSEAQEWNRQVSHPIQSWEWGEFRRANGNLVSRVNNFQIIWSKIPLTNLYFGYCGKCPIPTKSDLEALKEESKRVGGIGIRLEPNAQVGDLPAGLTKGRKFFTPKTFYLDLTKTEDELLRAMHPKGRYNIRVAQKHGVEIKKDDANFEAFLELTNATKARQGFYAHDDMYFKKMWETLQPSGIAHLFTATFEHQILAAWVIFKFGDFIYYPYGASSDEHREVMATSLLLWEIAKWGKAQGCTTFDLWGLEEGKGFTDFKRRFGPTEVEFIGTFDLPTSPLYGLFRFLEKTRWWILGSLRHMSSTSKV